VSHSIASLSESPRGDKIAPSSSAVIIAVKVTRSLLQTAHKQIHVPKTGCLIAHARYNMQEQKIMPHFYNVFLAEAEDDSA